VNYNGLVIVSARNE